VKQLRGPRTLLATLPGTSRHEKGSVVREETNKKEETRVGSGIKR